MSDRTVLLSIADDLATVTLNRPASGNAIDLVVAQDLLHALCECAREGVRAVALEGNGRIFCAGGDLVVIHGHGSDAPAYVRELLNALHEALEAIARMDAPVVAAVHGAAAGAGLSLMAACDLAIVTQSCRFRMAYSQVGVTPDGGSSWFLPRILGLRRALELSLLNRELSAAEALQWGLVNEVVADDTLAMRKDAVLAQLAAGPLRAFGGTKRLLRASFENGLRAQLELEADTICKAFAGAEAREGYEGFRTKSPPSFSRNGVPRP
jgi:2-(1,2-epoxy-1,2-dihydrophenyl)acetyl-CoA isomerase